MMFEFVVYWLLIGWISSFFLHLSFPDSSRRFTLDATILCLLFGAIFGPVMILVLTLSICLNIISEVIGKFNINFNKTIIDLDKPTFKKQTSRHLKIIDDRFDWTDKQLEMKFNLIGSAIERIDRSLSKLEKKSKRK